MLRESPVNLTLLQVHYMSHLQAYQPEIPTVMDTLEIWLVCLSNWVFFVFLFNRLSCVD